MSAMEDPVDELLAQRQSTGGEGQLNGLSSLATGTLLGEYVIADLISSSPRRNDYVVHLAPEDDSPAGAQEHLVRLRMIETAAGGLAMTFELEALQLRHPRLLALRQCLSQDDRDYAIIDLPDGPWPAPSSTNLSAEESLAVGVMIGEVLAFLHEHGVVHRHVQTANLIVGTKNIYLGGIEDATLLRSADTNQDALFAQDVNMLAQSLGDLVGPSLTPSPTSDALRRIVSRGVEGGYSMVRELIVELLQALPDGLPRLSETDARTPLTLEVGRCTSVGMVRQENQDAIGILSLQIDDDQPEATPGGVFIVADGMGGEAQGEVASRIAVRMILAEVARRFLSPATRATASDIANDEAAALEPQTTMNLDSIAALVESFRAANSRIRNMARRLERAAGTTATAIMLFAHEAILGHVGDSRAYLIRGNEVAQLTHDHSLLQRLIELGQYVPEQQGGQVPRNYLYRSLGQSDELEVDTRNFRVGAGDTFLLCSDGLWDLVNVDDIKEVLTSSRNIDEMAAELVRRANERGGHDNSSALIVRLAPQTR